MAYHEGRKSMPLAPYLDGSIKDVEVFTRGDAKLLRVATGGTYHFESQDGTCTNNEDGEDCADCGDRIGDGDGYWVYSDESSYVCQSCCNNDYYYAYSRRGNHRYIPNDNVIHVGDEAYDEEYLSDNSIVRLSRGEYVHTDNAVYVESVDEYYDCDDEAVCYDDYNNQYELREDCVDLADGSICHRDDAWQCEGSGEWYADNDVDSVEVDGKRYHPDNAPETDDETTEETTGE